MGHLPGLINLGCGQEINLGDGAVLTTVLWSCGSRWSQHFSGDKLPCAAIPAGLTAS